MTPDADKLKRAANFLKEAGGPSLDKSTAAGLFEGIMKAVKDITDEHDRNYPVPTIEVGDWVSWTGRYGNRLYGKVFYGPCGISQSQWLIHGWDEAGARDYTVYARNLTVVAETEAMLAMMEENARGKKAD